MDGPNYSAFLFSSYRMCIADKNYENARDYIENYAIFLGKTFEEFK